MLPTLFLGHGGGPLPLIGHAGHASLVDSWSAGGLVRATLHDPAVRAIVVVSAHHEGSGDGVDVMADAQPSLLFDYRGFPPETYRYALPNPGSPELAGRVMALLEGEGIAVREQRERGHDHGVFVPLFGLDVARKRPSLPVVSVSLHGAGSYRPGVDSQQFALGQALAPLRQEGVLLVGSGNSVHGRCTPAQSQAFDDHLNGLAVEGPAALLRWGEHVDARVCHPRPEHLLPLLVCAGAAPGAVVEAVRHTFMGDAASHFVFRVR
jgi:aromatic ring-opening dioxygenase catalytic subunit (LigB family)